MLLIYHGRAIEGWAIGKSYRQWQGSSPGSDILSWHGAKPFKGSSTMPPGLKAGLVYFKRGFGYNRGLHVYREE
jgi:hypothetical protein